MKSVLKNLEFNFTIEKRDYYLHSLYPRHEIGTGWSECFKVLNKIINTDVEELKEMKNSLLFLMLFLVRQTAIEWCHLNYNCLDIIKKGKFVIDEY
jgi:hypothetical protein